MIGFASHGPGHPGPWRFLANRANILKDLFFSTIGQLLAQVLTLAAMPVVTRIFTAHDLGIQGLFVSTTALFASIAALGFPYAVVLPRDDDDARALLRLSIWSTLAFGVVLEVFLCLCGRVALRSIGVEELADYIHILAAGSVLTSLALAYRQYFVRERLYREQSVVTLENSAFLNGGRIAVGFLSPTVTNLLWINVAANAVMLGQYVVRWQRRCGRLFVVREPRLLCVMAARYRDFPLLRMPQIAINAASQALPLWLLARFYGPASTGQYAVAVALLGAPSVLIGKAIADVFYPRLAAAYQEGRSARPLVIKATFATLVLVAAPYAAIVVFGPQIFRFVYGSNWGLAGEYGRWLSLWCMLQIVNRPAVVATFVLRIQGRLLIYELISTAAKIAALWIGFTVFANDVISVALFAVAGIAAYIGLIVWVIVRSKTAYEKHEETVPG